MNVTLTAVLKLVGNFFNGKEFATALRDKPSPDLLLSQGSMTKFLGRLIIEPDFVVSKEAAESPAYEDALGLQLNMFASLFSNAVQALTEIEDLDAKAVLNIVKSSKSSLGSGDDWAERVSLESDMNEDDIETLATTLFTVGLENNRKSGGGGSIVSDRSGKFSPEPTILNKYLNLKLRTKDRAITIPIIIRAHVTIVDQSTLKDYLTLNADDNKNFTRYHKYKSGEISSADYYLSLDLLKKYGKKIKQEGRTVLEDLEARKENALGNNNKTPLGFGRDYGAMIISSNEKRLLNVAIKGNIDKNDRDKQKMLKDTASFSLMILNDNFSHVAIYSTGFSGVSIIPFDKLKNKDDKNAVADIFEAISNNSKLRI